MKRLFLTLLTCFALIFPGISVYATELQTDIEDSGDPAEKVDSSVNENMLEAANATPAEVEELMRAITGAEITDETSFVIIYDEAKQEICDGTDGPVMIDADRDYSVYIAYRITDQGYPLWICANECPNFGEESLENETFALGAFLAMGDGEDYTELAHASIECATTNDVKFYLNGHVLRYDLACAEAIPVAENAFFSLNGEKVIPKDEPKDANFAGYVRYDFYTKSLSVTDDEQNALSFCDRQATAPEDDLRTAYNRLLDDDLAMRRRLNYLGWVFIVYFLMVCGYIVFTIIAWTKCRRKIAEYEDTIAQLQNSNSVESDEQ